MTKPNEQDCANLLSRAAYEIESLRKQNEILSAKVFVVETFALALKGNQSSLGYYSEDLAALLKKASLELNKPKEKTNE